jgi:hypothetical protein
LLERAIALLDSDNGPEAVIGPSEDGGFYALGLRRACPLVPVRWSTVHARADTEAALARAGIRCAQLDPWFDVDDAGDLARLVAGIHDGSIDAPHTARILARADRRQ